MVIQNILEPGHERTDAYFAMPYEDFRAIRLSETDKRKLVTPKNIEDFERITRTEHTYWQEKPMTLALAGLITGIRDLRTAFQPVKTNVPEIDLAKKSRSDSVSSKKTWSNSIEFKGNKVYQRNDLIDLTLKDARGRTNLDLMKSGRAPIGPDGESINLHHLLQTQQGPIAEMTQTFHQTYSRIIHINPSSMPTGINRVTFDKWRSDYWMARARDIMEKHK